MPHLTVSVADASVLAQQEMSGLAVVAPLNMFSVVVTAATFQSRTFGFALLAPWNASCMFNTL